MIHEFTYRKLADETEKRQLGQIIEQCFIGSPSDTESYINGIGVENFRVIRQAKEVVGGLGLLPMGQWYGGICVPMTGIAAVGIAPEYRGSGAAIALMQNVVRELHSSGIPLSVLYPAMQHLYRKAGYEQGGSHCGWEIPTQSIQVKEQLLPAIPVEVDNFEWQKLYQQQAKLNNGNLARHQSIWQRLIQSDAKETVYAYLLGSSDRPQGYIIFRQRRGENKSYLVVKDWAILTTAAAKSFWAFLAKHRSQIDKVQWRGSLVESLSLLLPEQTLEPEFVQRWLLRIVSVEKALSTRGYPSGVESELHLEVQDDLLEANRGRFILSVANGRGEVTRGGRGEMQLDVRGLAPLYTNLFTPQQLQQMGYLQATEMAIATATALFTNSSPWMPDFF
ncbi:GNAT family N-acetyltransferase [Chroococcidiopsis sp. FACHB-1243]|uniref:GNAT family N-acetyltransferase n=1 Tax=Chroococcidiopsis sp. [FACHB-1243] TaxID=2692781 RepID=UPI0017846835|nr:GNAT family N-acetyltransferase [Chroococcidiopsis sp. [FACHB-1243]]MBD2306778.1 GNAT family N-acetyltransferase [Chroococcidiopsis sp. [FACHB-1243]]